MAQSVQIYNKITLTVTFTLIPAAGLKYTLFDEEGNIINSVEDVPMTPGLSVDIILEGDDLAPTGVNDTGIRRVYVEGTENVGGASVNQSVYFIVDALRPVSLAEAKLQCRLYSDSTTDLYEAENQKIAQLTTSARIEIENMTGRKLVQQTVVEKFDAWADVVLKYGFIPSITSVAYNDPDDAAQTVSSSDYQLLAANEADSDISFLSDFDYPALADAKEQITVTYLTGFTLVPEPLKTAIKLKISDMYFDEDSSEAITAFISQYKRYTY